MKDEAQTCTHPSSFILHPCFRAAASLHWNAFTREPSELIAMKILLLFILVLSAFVVLGQDKRNPKTPVQILYGTAEPTGQGRGPLIAGVLNMRAVLEDLPTYPEKAKDAHIEGRVEIQVLVNEDGEVIFANPL